MFCSRTDVILKFRAATTIKDFFSKRVVQCNINRVCAAIFQLTHFTRWSSKMHQYHTLHTWLFNFNYFSTHVTQIHSAERSSKNSEKFTY